MDLRMQVAVVLFTTLGAVHAQNMTTVDACPAAKWTALPFLRSQISFEELNVIVETVQNDTTQLIEFVKTDVVPALGANAVFLAIALLFILIFILWRPLRWCCFACCCKGSCDARRSKNDPMRLLFGYGMITLKVLMFLVGVVAICFAIFGMVRTRKQVSSEVWELVDHVSVYTTNLTTTMDRLLGTIGNATGIIEQLQAIVIEDVDVSGFTANLTVVGYFLDRIPDPVIFGASLTGLQAHLTALRASLVALGASLTALGTQQPLMVSQLTTVAGAAPLLAGMTGALNALDTAITGLPGVEPGDQQASAAFTAYSSAVTGVVPSAWVTSLNGVSAALSGLAAYQGGGANPLTDVASKLAAVQGSAATILNTDVPGITNALTNITAEYAVAQPAIAWTLAQLVHVNATVLELNVAMQTAYDQLNDASTQLAAFFGSSPSPAVLAAQVSGLTSSFALPATTAALSATLTAAAAALDAAPLATAKSQIDSLVNDMTTFSAAYTSAVSNPRNTYASTQSNWAAMRTSSVGFQPSIATSLTVVSTASTSLNAAGAAGLLSNVNGVTTASQVAFVTSATAAVDGLPPLGTLVGAVGDVAVVYVALGAPPSSALGDARAALDSISAAAITTGNQVKQQIQDTVASFSGGSDSLQDAVTARVAEVEEDYKPLADQADWYRFLGAVVLYGVSIALIVFLFACYLGNYHFGASFFTLLLLLVVALYLLLAFALATALFVLHETCPNVEPLVLKYVPGDYAALARYYFFNEGGNVTAVLKAAGLVDVDAVLAQVAASRGSLVSAISGDFVFRPAPLAVLDQVNTTIDTALGYANQLLDSASYDAVHPIYVDVKALACCWAPDIFGDMWIALTFAGICALFLALLTFFYLHKLDWAPRTDCCGCTCHTWGRYATALRINPPEQGANPYAPIYSSSGGGGYPATAAPGAYVAPQTVLLQDGSVYPTITGMTEEGPVVAHVVVRPLNAPRDGKALPPV